LDRAFQEMELSTVLEVPADRFFEALLRPEHFRRVIRPLAHVELVGEPWPARWQEGRTYWCACRVFGIPIGLRELRIARVDAPRRRLQSQERDRLVTRWEHTLAVEVVDERRCRYTDTLVIEAGALTWLVRLWAWGFYRYRQWRWRQEIDRIAR
jgi:hypothetical protein